MARLKSDLRTKIFSSKIFIVCVFIALALIGKVTAKEFYQKYQIQKEISSLEEEIEKVEESNKEFSRMIEFLKTDSYLEREIRLKFNFQKPGEKAVVISKESRDVFQKTQENDEAIISEEKNQKRISNPRKWWNYLFADK